MQFEIAQGGGPPVGVYKAKFGGVEETQHDEFGAGLKFVFEITSGEHAGEQATRITGPKPTPKNACGRMLAGISGETLKPGVTIDLAPHVDKTYMIQVQETKNDATRIETIIKAGEDF